MFVKLAQHKHETEVNPMMTLYSMPPDFSEFQNEEDLSQFWHNHGFGGPVTNAVKREDGTAVPNGLKDILEKRMEALGKYSGLFYFKNDDHHIWIFIINMSE